MRLPDPSGTLGRLSQEDEAVAVALGDAVAELSIDEAGFILGSTYASMLPKAVRAKGGIYYTPPALVSRLLDIAENAGVDWSTARVLDPACGGGAFLGPVATRMIRHMHGCDRRVIIRNVVNRLHGYEIDPYAAWISKACLAATFHVALNAGSADLANVVSVCDSTKELCADDYDLVIGNPPYGRVSLTREQRAPFQRSLFGHANLYSVFLDIAITKSHPSNGVIAYVTPTSFLSGEYFKRLRELLAKEANPASLDLVAERSGVFDGVLQETTLAAFRRGRSKRKVSVNFLATKGGELEVKQAGVVPLPKEPSAPWVLPRRSADRELARQMQTLDSRLVDWGYKVSTGPLVWNRYKSQLKLHQGENRIPIIWAECVTADGRFELRSSRRNHLPYFALSDADEWLRIRQSCVLLQRTTAKEQPRRLIAAELPSELVGESGGVTVENHLNMLIPTVEDPPVSTRVLAAFLNSAVADRAFRCISGSVAVSAYELHSLPLPSAGSMAEVEALLQGAASRSEAESLCQEVFFRGGC